MYELSEVLGKHLGVDDKSILKGFFIVLLITIEILHLIHYTDLRTVKRNLRVEK